MSLSRYPGVTRENKALARPPGFSLISVLDLTWISWILPHFGAGFDPDLRDLPYFKTGLTPFSLLLPHQFHPSPPRVAGAQLGAGGVELGRAAVRGKGLGPV